MQLRDNNLRRLASESFDVLVVGGGINGAVSAAALSARGARVALVDRQDFASATSQESSNLAWGGIKYLETFEFNLVRKLCDARNKLIRSYPSTVQEIRFYVSHEKNFRHGLWKLVAGAWLYWFIGKCFTAAPRLLTRRTMTREEPQIRQESIDGGFEYSDAYLHDNDARFVFGFVRSAMNYGCAAANYTEVVSATRDGSAWKVRLRDVLTGREFDHRAKHLVNAGGPWADELSGRAGTKTEHHHVFSKGIHLIVPSLTPHRRVITFFADDGRLFFVIPMGPRTCIGTTDTRVEKPEVTVTAEDRRFVLDNINKRLNLPRPLTEADIVAERCGVRPLVVRGGGKGSKDWMQMSRKHAVEADAAHGVVSVFGGKLTDCLNVGEEVCDELTAMGLDLPFRHRTWYGEPPDSVRDEYFHQARLMELDALTAPSANEKLSTRLWRRYGANALPMLEAIRADPKQAELIIENAEYARVELEEASRREMITRLDDFLRRRSKISLVVSHTVLREAAGLREACRILFGADAEARYDEYFAAEDKRRAA